MANPIISSYLHDTSMDVNKRKFVLKQINDGVDENELAGSIVSKYGEKYGTHQDLLKSQVASGIMGVAKNTALKSMAPDPTKLPEASNFDKVTNAIFENPTAKEATDKWNAEHPTEPKEHTNLFKDIKDVGVSGYQGVKSGLETAGQGAYNVRTALFPDTAEVSPTGQTVNPYTGDVAKPLPNTPLEKVGAVLEGGKDIIKGSMEGAFAMPGAIANKVPVLDKIPGAINAVSDAAANKTIEVAGIDPNSEQAAHIRDGMNLLTQTLLLKHGETIGKTVGEVGKLGLSTAGDLAKGTLDLAGRAGEAIKEVPGKVIEGVKGKFSPEMNLSEQLMKAGTSEQAANLLEKLTPEQRAVANEYLDVGTKKLQTPVGTPGVFDHAGKEVEDFLSNAKITQKNIGQQLGAVKTAMAETSVNDLTPVKNSLDRILKDLNVKQTSEGLNFSDSKIARETSANQMIQKIFDKVNTDRETMGIPAKDLEALTAQIESATKELVNKSKKSVGNRSLTNLKTAINETLNTASPEFADLNKKYAKISQHISRVENATKVPLGNGEIAQSGAQLLRRSLGNADTKYTRAIGSMDALEKEFGIKAPIDLKTKAHLANFAEKFTQSTQPQSLTGGVAQGLKEGLQNEVMAAGKRGILRSIPVAGEPLAAIADALKVPKKNIEIAAAKIQKILSDAEEKAPDIKTSKSNSSSKASKGFTIKPVDFDFLKAFMAKMLPYSGGQRQK